MSVLHKVSSRLPTVERLLTSPAAGPLKATDQYLEADFGASAVLAVLALLVAGGCSGGRLVDIDTGEKATAPTKDAADAEGAPDAAPDGADVPPADAADAKETDPGSPTDAKDVKDAADADAADAAEAEIKADAEIVADADAEDTADADAVADAEPEADVVTDVPTEAEAAAEDAAEEAEEVAAEGVEDVAAEQEVAPEVSEELPPTDALADAEVPPTEPKPEDVSCGPGPGFSTNNELNNLAAAAPDACYAQAACGFLRTDPAAQYAPFDPAILKADGPLLDSIWTYLDAPPAAQPPFVNSEVELFFDDAQYDEIGLMKWASADGVAAIEYDPDLDVLTFAYANGGVYAYYDYMADLASSVTICPPTEEEQL